MLITNHVLSGALIGGMVRRPLPAFLAGIASHFVLDALPHWGRWDDDRQFMRVAVGDGLAGLAVMGALAAAAPPGRRAAVVAGMAGAALPDIDKPSQRWFGESPWPDLVDRFHTGIQDEAPDRFGHEALAAALLAAALMAARRSLVCVGLAGQQRPNVSAGGAECVRAVAVATTPAVSRAAGGRAAGGGRSWRAGLTSHRTRRGG